VRAFFAYVSLLAVSISAADLTDSVYESADASKPGYFFLLQEGDGYTLEGVYENHHGESTKSVKHWSASCKKSSDAKNQQKSLLNCLYVHHKQLRSSGSITVERSNDNELVLTVASDDGKHTSVPKYKKVLPTS